MILRIFAYTLVLQTRKRNIEPRMSREVLQPPFENSGIRF